MSYVGSPLRDDVMFLVRGRDFVWGFELVTREGVLVDWPAGELFFEVFSDPVRRWDCRVEGAQAFVGVGSGVTDLVPNRCRWQLVWLPVGGLPAGVPVARGYVKVLV